MKIVNVHEAKSQLSKLIAQVEAGEDVVIARAGKPAVRLIAFQAAATPRVGGIWRNQVRMTEDFDVLPEEWLSVFEGDGCCHVTNAGFGNGGDPHRRSPVMSGTVNHLSVNCPR